MWFRYGRSAPWALRDISVQLDDRATVLIGPNGAGKSTLLRLMAGHLRPGRGRVHAAAAVGFSPQMPIQLPGLSVERQVRYAAWLAGVPRGDTPALAQRALAATDLTDLSDRDATRLSGGQAARLGIACALAPTPRYLLLDEPTASLDPLSRRSVTSVLRTLSENGVRIVASSHTASDVGDPFTRLIVLDQGTVVFDASVETFLTGDHHVPVVADLAQALRER